MLITIFGIIPILLLITIATAGSIQPYGRRPIDVSVNNIKEPSSYTFNFLSETDTHDGKPLVK